MAFRHGRRAPRGLRRARAAAVPCWRRPAAPPHAVAALLIRPGCGFVPPLNATFSTASTWPRLALVRVDAVHRANLAARLIFRAYSRLCIDVGRAKVSGWFGL